MRNAYIHKQKDQTLQSIWLYIQSPHELRGVMVMGVSGIGRITASLFHHQSVLNVHVQRIFGYDLNAKTHSINKLKIVY